MVKMLLKMLLVLNTLVVTKMIKVKPLCVMLPKGSVYTRIYCNKTQYMSYFKEDDELLEKYNKIWNNIY